MRDIGTVVWVVLVVIGVVSSMISSIRKQAQQRGTATEPQRRARYVVARMPNAPAQTAAAPPQPAQAAPPPKPRAAPARPEVHAEAPRSRAPWIFAGKGQLVRAVIAAELLGKPRGLSDEHFPR